MLEKSGRARPTRVCMLTSVHPPLDTRIFHREAKAARDAGFAVTVIAPGAPASRVEGIRLVSIPSWGGRWARPFRWPVLFFKAWRRNADIYHFHDPELLPWGLLLKWTRRRAVIYDSHEYLRESISTRYWIPARLRRPAAAIADRVEKWIAGRLDAVIAVTDDMADRFRPVQKNVVTIRNLPPPQEIPEPGEGRKPFVMYAGLTNRGRGLEILHETARLVRERRPEARFVIYGSVDWHGIDPAIAAMTPDEWAGLGVEFRGSIPYDQVGPALAEGIVGWLPRSASEPNNYLAWPNKLVEYMAAGLAIVASDLPAQAAVIRESNTGLVVAADDAASHADAICALLADAEAWRRYSVNGKGAARNRYTWKAEALKLHTVYMKLTGYNP